MRYPILLLCFFFAACTDQNENVPYDRSSHIRESTDTASMILSGMRYAVIHNNSVGAISVVNLTKDSLDCAVLMNKLRWERYSHITLDSNGIITFQNR